MCRLKNTVNQRKEPKTLQRITTLYSLRHKRECGVANDRTTADCNQQAGALAAYKKQQARLAAAHSLSLTYS